MRKLVIIGLSALLLAGCGSGLVQIDEGNNAGPAAGGPGGPSQPNAPGPVRPARTSREGTIRACVEDLTRSLPRGTNIQPLCECTVDRMLAGTGQMDALRQCAREQNVTLPGQ